MFTSDEYRQWLSRTPSTSAIYEQIRASRDVLNQQRAARFTYSAENIHAALKDVSCTFVRNIVVVSHFAFLFQAESGYYSSYGRPGATTTLDRNFARSQHPVVPARSLSTQHITSSTSGDNTSTNLRVKVIKCTVVIFSFKFITFSVNEKNEATFRF